MYKQLTQQITNNTKTKENEESLCLTKTYLVIIDSCFSQIIIPQQQPAPQPRVR